MSRREKTVSLLGSGFPKIVGIGGDPDSGEPLNIVISHAYSRNDKGDAAQLSVLINELESEFEPENLVVLTIEKTETGETFEGVPFESNFYYLASFRYTKKLAKLFFGLFILFATLVWSYAYRILGIKLWLPRRILRLVCLYAEADLIVAVGGGYLSGTRRLNSVYNTVLMMHPLVLASVLRKPTVLFSQSVGPFPRGFERYLVGRVLARCVSMSLLREDYSMAYLHNLGVRNIVRTVDSGFMLGLQGPGAILRLRFGLTDRQLLIGITARQWLDVDGFDQESYERGLASMIDHLIESFGAAVVFIPQCTAVFFGDDDRVIHRSIVSKVVHRSNTYLLEDEFDCHEIKSLYGELDGLIGTRLHSVIFAISSHIPAIAIQHEYKTSGIMEDLGLSDWLLKREDVNSPLATHLIDRLICENDLYRERLLQIIPPYIEQAHEATILTRTAFYAHQVRESRRAPWLPKGAPSLK